MNSDYTSLKEYYKNQNNLVPKKYYSEEYKDEYDIFVEVTENDMIPAMLIIEGDNKKHKSFLYAPERNYNELTEAVTIIQGHQKKLGLI